jgi:hypothetical protein
VRKIKILKQELKALACAITKSKIDLKDCQRKHCGDCGYWTGQPGYSVYKNHGKETYDLKFEFRHKHIAYCLLRGRTIEQIEMPAKDNQPDIQYIERIQNEYREEDVCVGTPGSI